MIDTQAHIIDPARWPLPAGSAGYRPKPDEIGTADALIAEMDANGVSHAILVQASGWGEYNRPVVETAAAHPERFRAVVMCADDEDTLRAMADDPAVVGVRLNIVDFGPHGASPDRLGDAVRRIAAAGLVVQLQARPDVLEVLAPAIGRAAMPVVIDHCGLPDLRPGGDGIDRLLRVADRAPAILKLSAPFRLGLRHFGDGDVPLRRLAAAFGPDRCVWASDWPFIKLGDAPMPRYAELLDWAETLVGASGLAAAEATARRVFGLAGG